MAYFLSTLVQKTTGDKLYSERRRYSFLESELEKCLSHPSEPLKTFSIKIVANVYNHELNKDC
jgi:hypothetical protein